MKKVTLIFLVIIISCKQEVNNRYTVKGEIKGLTPELTYKFYIQNEDGKRDTVFIKNGIFKHTSLINDFRHIRIEPDFNSFLIKKFEDGFFSVDCNSFDFFASPGEEVLFKGEVTDFVNAYPYGSKANNDLARLNKMIFPLMNRVGNLKVKKSKISKKDSISVHRIKDLINMYENRILQHKKEYITTNPNSDVSVLVDFANIA